jgi:hypothetical protein
MTLLYLYKTKCFGIPRALETFPRCMYAETRNKYLTKTNGDGVLCEDTPVRQATVSHS